MESRRDALALFDGGFEEATYPEVEESWGMDGKMRERRDKDTYADRGRGCGRNVMPGLAHRVCVDT